MRKNIRQLANYQKGLGIIELMVAILISLFLVGGLLQMFISNQQTYRTQAGMARLQENARFVSHELNKELRMANSAGCSIFPAASADIKNYFATSKLPWDFSNGSFRGYEYDGASWSPSLPTAYDGFAHADIDNDSDVLVIRRMSDVVGRLSSDYSTGANQITVDMVDGLTFAVNDIVIVNDCGGNVGLAQITGVSGTTTKTLTLAHTAAGTYTPGYKTEGGVDKQGLPLDFPQGSVVGKLNTSIYYLSGSPRALTKAVLNKGRLEKQTLVKGIDSLQFVYGEDTTVSGVADTFNTADQVTTWADVVAIRATFTASTVETIDPDIVWTNSDLSGALSDMSAAEASALNGRILRRFSTLIALRNKELH